MARFRKTYRKRGRGKWRQQKLAIGTVQKIARRVAKMQIAKQEEPLFSSNILGGRAGNNTEDTVRCVVTRSGLFEIAPGLTNLLSINNAPVQHHPQTFPYQLFVPPSGVPQTLSVQSMNRFRAGRSIHLKGLAVKGYLCLGKDMGNARVHLGIYSSEDTLVNPQGYLPELDGIQMRRDIPDTEKLNGTKAKTTITLNHRANDQEVKIPVNLYLKVDKRITYNPKQTTSTPAMDELWYEDKRYYLIIYSDTKDDILSGGIASNIPNAQLQATLDRFPTFYGRFTAYYRDS